MDQSPKAKGLILKYEQDSRNNKWYMQIFNRLQRLSCCVRGEAEIDPKENHCGEGDIPLSLGLPPYLVEIPTVISDEDNPEIKSISCEEEVQYPKFNPLSLKDLATKAYYKSKSSGPRRRGRRHAFYQAVYTGGFQSFVGHQ